LWNPKSKAVNTKPKTVKRPNFHVVIVGKTYNKEKLYYLQGVLAGTIKNESKMKENLKPTNLKLGSYCI
jgi:hypothetical protein